MQYINSEEELQQYLMGSIKTALDNAAKQIQDSLSMSIYYKVYSKTPSSYYKRTGNFLQSVIKPKVKMKGLELEVEIGLDSEKLNQIHSSMSNHFNTRMNLDGTNAYKIDPYSWNGKNIKDMFYQWYDEGTTNSVLPSVPQTNFWYEVMGSRLSEDNPKNDKAYSKFEKELKKILSNYGTVVENVVSFYKK
jgi:hypothetical protein